MTVPRTDDDSWDINESVGTTALGVAAARAVETESDDPLIEDRFARVFLDAAGEGMWSVFADAALRDQLAEADPELPVRMRAMVDFMAARTAFFDEFFTAAAGAGVRQVVILAAGLDSRAWRLPWPDATTVYELDQPKVLEFKSSTLRRHGASPTSTLVNVPVDLRQDWPKALQDSGFDASAPTAWSAEGLLRFLPAWAQDLLFERIHALSTPGSRLAVNAPGKDFLDPDQLAQQRERMQRIRAAAARLVNTEIPDVVDLWYAEERADVADWLRGHGWDPSQVTAAELTARYGRSIPAGVDDAMSTNLFISAQRPR
jgi:methyltransferase (TIGR00027 family)